MASVRTASAMWMGAIETGAVQTNLIDIESAVPMVAT
jgi:hypothetical protein